ncbi:MAG: GHKL domain-containing protein [Oscillospiraceae bacterium]|nr:GHKL domain-containing protein [Oscillospiraceae bacterium]
MTIASEFLASFIRIFLCLFFIKKDKPDVKALLISVAGAGLSCVVLRFTDMPLLYLPVCEVIAVLLCLELSRRSGRRNALFFCIMYEIGISLWTFIFGKALASVSGMGDFASRLTLWGQLPLWIVNAVLVIVAVLIGKGKEITIRAASLAAVLGMFGVVAFSENTASDDMTFTYLILSVILLAGIMVHRLSRQYETEKELAELKEKQAEILERDYNLLNKAYSENAKTFHDMHNHIGAVRSLLTAKKYDKAIEYLDDLQKPVSGMTCAVWTGDETVDYLINSRIATAENEGFSFETHIEFPKNTDICGADLCAVLGNLLDNAFDAVRKDDSTKNRRIILTIRRINRMLVIKVVNTFNGEINISGGKLKTTKTDGGLHGWGVESARTAAAKYDGTITTTAEDDIFTAVATLSF